MDRKEATTASSTRAPGRGRPITAGLELTESGAWMTLGLAEGSVELNLSEEGLASRSLFSGRAGTDERGQRRLRFVSVLERLGEDAAVSSASDERSEKPQNLLRGVLAGARVGARALAPETDTLVVVVPGCLGELQRSLVLKAGEAAGWGTTQVVNRTLAVAAGTLARSALGHHLVFAFDHSLFEAALLEVVGGAPQVRAYVSDTALCGDYLDAVVIASILSATGNLEAEALGGVLTFAWLKQRVQQLRQKIALYDSVRIDLPDGVLGDGTRAFTLSQREFLGLMRSWPDRIGAHVGTLLGPLAREGVAGVIVAGDLGRHPAVLDSVREAFPASFVTLADPHAATRGAVSVTERERAGVPLAAAASPRAVVPEAASTPRQYVIRSEPRATVAPTPAPEAGEIGLADGIIHRVRELARQGKRSEAEAELSVLRNYVDALELSLKDPAEALRADAVRGDTSGGSRGEPRPPAAESVRAAVDDAKQKRREYLRAHDEIKTAERMLKEGRFEQAVAHSHLAYKESADGRIFRAMIKVHLRAARQTPTLQNFADHRGWLLCALHDDPTGEEVQEAVRSRFVAHAAMLAGLETPQARHEARKTLDELKRFVEPGEAAAAIDAQLAPKTADAPEGPAN